MDAVPHLRWRSQKKKIRNEKKTKTMEKWSQEWAATAKKRGS